MRESGATRRAHLNPPAPSKKKKQFPSPRNSDQHQFSPNNLDLYSGEKVMRVNNLIGGT